MAGKLAFVVPTRGPSQLDAAIARFEAALLSLDQPSISDGRQALIEELRRANAKSFLFSESTWREVCATSELGRVFGQVVVRVEAIPLVRKALERFSGTAGPACELLHELRSKELCRLILVSKAVGG